MNLRRMALIGKLYFMSITGRNYKKAETIRKAGMFAEFGGGGYWHPTWIPSYPELIYIGNNVTVAADVRFYEHDLVNRMFNNDPTYSGPKVPYYTGKIVIGDNVVLCARSIILYNVNIGHNALVAAGSVVTKSVEPYAIVAGNPARKIGDTRVLLEKRSGIKTEAE